MTSRIPRIATALLAALALVTVPLLTATSASAATATTHNTVFFSNGAFTDPAEEDATMIGALSDAGIPVTVFDGGDGSASAWIAALAGNGVLVIPESSTSVYEPGGTSAMSDAAAAAVLAFVTAGGTLILGANDNSTLLSYLTGLNYASVWSKGGSGGPWDLQIVNPDLPAQVTYSDGTYPVVNFNLWSVDLLDGVLPLYVGDGGNELASGVFPVGVGAVLTLAYDWYPGEDESDISGRDLWNQVLVQGAVGVPGVAPAAPALANTGIDTTIFVTGALGLLMLGAAALIVTRTRRVLQA